MYPDSVVGTDSHTTMIDGLGVAGWGVGGIEAEAAMLGQVPFLSCLMYLYFQAGLWHRQFGRLSLYPQFNLTRVFYIPFYPSSNKNDLKS